MTKLIKGLPMGIAQQFQRYKLQMKFSDLSC